MNMRALAKALGTPHWLDHLLLRWMQIGIIIIGCAFWIEARMKSEAFSKEIYGAFAVQFPAELWAGATVTGSLIIWIGLLDPMKRWIVAVGAAIQTVQYMGLGYSAVMTGGELVIGVHCTVLFAPIFAAIFWRAVYDANP